MKQQNKCVWISRLGISYKIFHRPDLTVDHEPLIPDVEVDADLALQKVIDLIGN